MSSVIPETQSRLKISCLVMTKLLPPYSHRLVLTGDGPFCLVRGLALLHNMVGTRMCGEDVCRRRHACSGAFMTLWLDLFALDDCRFARLHECTGHRKWVSTVAEVCD